MDPHIYLFQALILVVEIIVVDVLVVDIRRSSRMVTRKNQGYLCLSLRPSKAKLGGIAMLFTPNPPSHPVEITAVMKNILAGALIKTL